MDFLKKLQGKIFCNLRFTIISQTASHIFFPHPSSPPPREMENSIKWASFRPCIFFSPVLPSDLRVESQLKVHSDSRKKYGGTETDKFHFRRDDSRKDFGLLFFLQGSFSIRFLRIINILKLLQSLSSPPPPPPPRHLTSGPSLFYVLSFFFAWNENIPYSLYNSSVRYCADGKCAPFHVKCSDQLPLRQISFKTCHWISYTNVKKGTHFPRSLFDARKL